SDLIEVVARPRTPVIDGIRLTNTPVDQVLFGIVRAVHPWRAAACLPCLVRRPRLMARFIRPRHGVEAPQLFAGGSVVRVDESARALVAARAPHDQTVPDDERRLFEIQMVRGP